MKDKSYWIEQLNLQPHPEGGYFCESYRSSESFKFEGFEGERELCTAIYFLIGGDDFSAFHRIKSDELWHFYAGDPLIVHMIDREGKYSSQVLGKTIEAGEKLQFVVPAGVWFASEVKGKGDYALVGCTVAPGFDFRDFALADERLISDFPQYREVISRLTR